MSEMSSHEVRQDPDVLASRQLVVILISAICLGVFGCFIAWVLIDSNYETGLYRDTLPVRAPTAPAVIGRVDQTLIDVTQVASKLAEEQARILRTYQWVDRESGVARIPIDVAIRAAAAEAEGAP